MLVFLSYNSEDRECVEELRNRIALEKIPVWFDRNTVEPGDLILDNIGEGLSKATCCAICLGPSGEGKWQRREIAAAYTRYVNGVDPNFRLVPILLPGAVKERIHSLLAPLLYVDFRSGVHDQQAFKLLTDLITGKSPKTGTPLDPTHCPYPGLEPFTESQGHQFFGRDDEIERLATLVRDHPFTGVTGDSGSGKSSLVRAGLHTETAFRTWPALKGMKWLTIVPGADPFHALATQISLTLDPQLESDRRLASVGQLSESLKARTDGLRTVLLTFPKLAGEGILFVDQLEEVLTHGTIPDPSDPLGSGTSRQETFFANLADWVEHGNGRWRVVVTYRSDFKPRLQQSPTLREFLRRPELHLEPLSRASLARAITQPAIQAGAILDYGLVESILRDAGDSFRSLPLLQLTLKDLWNRSDGPSLSLATYERTGGLIDALRQRTQASLKAVGGEEDLGVARNVLLRLVNPGEGVEDTRRRVAREELYPACLERNRVDRILTILSHRDSRLIVMDSEQKVVLAHESLIRHWAELRDWIHAGRDRIKWLRKLTWESAEWARNDRNHSYLLTGRRLREAQRRRCEDPADLNAAETEFLDASRRDDLRKRWTMGIVSGALLALLTLAAFDKWREYRIARARELVAWSEIEIGRDPELSVQLIRRAAEFSWGHSEDQYRRALQASRIRAAIQANGGRIHAIAVAPDGERIATAHADGIARVWNWNSGTLGAKPEFVLDPGTDPHSDVLSVAFSHDGNRVATGTLSGEARLWDLRTTASPLAFHGHSNAVKGVVFGGGDTFLATASTDGYIHVRSLSDGQTTILGDGQVPWTCLASGPGREELTAGGEDGVVRSWKKLSNGWSPATLAPRQHTDLLTAVDFDQTGARTLSADQRGHVALGSFDSETPQSLPSQDSGVFAASFNAFDDFVATAGGDGICRFWSPVSGSLIGALPTVGAPIRCLAFHPSKPYLITGSDHGWIQVWELPFGDFLGRQGNGIRDLTVVPDAESPLVLARDDNNTLVTYATGKALSPPVPPPATGVLAVTRDGRYYLRSGVSVPEALEIRQRAFDTLRRSLSEGSKVQRCAFSPNGKWLFTALSSGKLLIWETEGASAPWSKEIGANAVTVAVFDPDSSHLFVALEAGTPWIWKLPGTNVHELPSLPPEIHAAAFIPTGSRIAIASSTPARTVEVWDWQENAKLAKLEGHEGQINSIALSPSDPRFLLTASADGTARVWNWESGRQLMRFAGPNSRLVSAVFTSGSRHIVTGDVDGQVRLYPCPELETAERLQILSKERKTRELSPEEKHRFRLP